MKTFLSILFFSLCFGSLKAQVYDKSTIKSWFQNRDKPTQEQYWHWMDSYWHKNDTIPLDKVKGLDSALNEHLTEADPFFVENGVPKTRSITINGESKTLDNNVEFNLGAGGNSNIGTGFRIAINGTGDIKTIYALPGVIIDSSTVENALTIRPDTSLLQTIYEAKKRFVAKNLLDSIKRINDTIDRKHLWVIGHSISAGGQVISTPQRYTTQLANMLNLIEDNRGIFGTTVKYSTAGDSSAVERLSNKWFIPDYNSNYQYMIIDYGVNDLTTFGIGDTANFKTAYNRMLDTIAARGWALSKVIVMGVGVGPSNASAMNNVIKGIATGRGCKFINVNDIMANNGGVSLTGDNKHYNNLGTSVIVNAVLDSLQVKAGRDVNINGTVALNGSIGIYIPSDSVYIQSKNANTPAIAMMPVAISVTDEMGQAQDHAFFELRGSFIRRNLNLGMRNGWLDLYGTDNVAVGRQTFQANRSGSQNVAVGNLAMSGNVSGNANTAIGHNSLASNISASGNTAGGFAALGKAMSSNNTAWGAYALRFDSTGSNNTAVGYKALYNNVSGSNNAAFGFNALDTSNGNDNTGLGFSSLSSMYSGDRNVAVGSGASALAATVSNITSIGYRALYNNQTNNTVAIGYNALFNNTTGTGNTGLGYQSMYSNTTGQNNVSVGQNALYSNVIGGRNTAVGTQALTNNTGSGNSALGYLAAQNNTSGINNTAIGNTALQANTTGKNNTAIGNLAANASTNNDGLVAVGYEALQNTTVGEGTAVGYVALQANTTGAFVTAIGTNALTANTTGNNNTSAGAYSMWRNTTGNNNTALGYIALRANTEGDSNTIIGYNGGDSILSGDKNISIGANGLQGTITGSGNINLANDTRVGKNSGNNLIISNGFNIGDVEMNRTTVIGANGRSDFYADSSGNVTVAKDTNTVTIPGIAKIKKTPEGLLAVDSVLVKSADGTVKAIAPIPQVTSGHYTATLTNTANITSSSFDKATYTQIGDVVTVTISGSITPTASATLTQLTFSLPVNPGGVTQYRAGTIMFSDNAGDGYYGGHADVGATSGMAYFISGPTNTSGNFVIQIQYEISHA